jgi:hypothetical protein
MADDGEHRRVLALKCALADELEEEARYHEQRAAQLRARLRGMRGQIDELVRHANGEAAV